VLRHENAVLRRHVAGPVRYETADRFWFAALSSLIPTPMARRLPGHPSHAAHLAPQVHRRQMGLPPHTAAESDAQPPCSVPKLSRGPMAWRFSAAQAIRRYSLITPPRTRSRRIGVLSGMTHAGSWLGGR
jgi:hypothetical protein